jgi:hypothetical protein
MALIPFDNKFIQYLAEVVRNYEAGTLGGWADPAMPTDLGTPLNQADIDFIKILRKEMERFNAPEN